MTATNHGNPLLATPPCTTCGNATTVLATRYLGLLVCARCMVEPAKCVCAAPQGIAGDVTTGIDDLLRQYSDAIRSASLADANAGPEYEDTDPDCDRAWEQAAKLRTAIGLHVRALEAATVAPSTAGERAPDGETPDEAGEAVATEMLAVLVRVAKANGYYHHLAPWVVTLSAAEQSLLTAHEDRAKAEGEAQHEREVATSVAMHRDTLYARIAAVEQERDALRDAVHEYDYLRRDCPDEATRDAGWAHVMVAMGSDRAAGGGTT